MSAADSQREDGVPVGRLAPSPTGDLHLGHARSFLLAWWSVRSRGGRIVLRIEDLDRARVKPGAVERSLRDLEWLGLDWDVGPLLQSEEVEPMQAAVDRLVAAGQAYPCTCSRREVRASLSAPHREGDELRYPGTCRGRYATVEEAESHSGRIPGLRFRVPEGSIEWEDGFAGRHANDVGAEVGDFLLARRDGVFAYQLAVVVDDARQGVTEVLRGDDLLASTARQLLLQRALGLPHPTWIHVPLVADADGRRLSKRDRDLGLTELRGAGVDPRRVVTWAARSAGLDTPELLNATEARTGIDLGRVPREPLRLTPEDLAWIRAGQAPSAP